MCCSRWMHLIATFTPVDSLLLLLPCPQVIDLPATAPSPYDFACTLPPNTGDVSGGLGRSRSGQQLNIGCFGAPAQTGLGVASYNARTFPRIVAKITQDGIVNTSAGLSDAWNLTTSTIFSALVDDTVTPAQHYVSGSLVGVGGIYGGIRVFPQNSRTSIALQTGGTFRTFATDRNDLFISYSGVAINQGVVRLSQPGSAWPVSTAGFSLQVIFTNTSGFTSTAGDPRAPAIGGVAFNGYNEMWTADCTFGLNKCVSVHVSVCLCGTLATAVFVVDVVAAAAYRPSRRLCL